MAETTMPGEAAVMKGCPKPPPALCQRQAECLAFVFQRRPVHIPDSAQVHRRLHVGNRFGPHAQEGLVFAHQPRIAEHVLPPRPFPAPAEAAHAVLDIEEEPLPLLFPIVADGDAGLDLAGDDRIGRLTARNCQRLGIDGPALRAASVQAGQFKRPGQAAGVSRGNGHDRRLRKRQAG